MQTALPGYSDNPFPPRPFHHASPFDPPSQTAFAPTSVFQHLYPQGPNTWDRPVPAYRPPHHHHHQHHQHHHHQHENPRRPW